METTMKQDDIAILKEVQKNTKMAMTAIDTMLDKVTDDDFSRELSKQSLRYSEIYNEALDKILENQGSVYRGNQISELMLKSSIHANTALNISTGHIAELMIQGSNRGLTSMWKTMKHNSLATNDTVEIAQELVDFEEESIERWKEYL